MPADPKHDMVVAAALESNAAYIVSEHKHLLKLVTRVGGPDFATQTDRPNSRVVSKFSRELASTLGGICDLSRLIAS